MGICKLGCCNNKVTGNGYCNKHYLRYWKNKPLCNAQKSFTICENPKCKKRFIQITGYKNKRFCSRKCLIKMPLYVEIQKRSSIKRYEKNPSEFIKKYKARHKAYCIKRQVCIVKNCNEIGERHHKDYDKPLEVIFLCSKHHKKHHFLKSAKIDEK